MAHRKRSSGFKENTYLTGVREPGEGWLSSTSISYMALCVCQLMGAVGWGGGMLVNGVLVLYSLIVSLYNPARIYKYFGFKNNFYSYLVAT